MPGENSGLARDYLAAERSRTALPSTVPQGSSRCTTNRDLTILRSEARFASQSTQLRGQSSAAMSKAPLPAEVQAGKQMSREQSNSRVPTAQAQPIQEEASGYASTESDSDTGTNDRVQRKPTSPGAQPIRDYKGQSRQMITMAFLEEGGYFDVPIQVASARLGLGVTTLKRVCRASNMKRWPFRKRNSLGRLIDRTKQVLDDGTGQDNMQKLAALQVLEKQRQVMRSCQSKDMDEKIKSYRQAIFKLDHAERKRGEAPPSKEQSPPMSKMTANSAVQRILPGQEGAAAPHMLAHDMMAQSSSSTQAFSQN